MLRGIPRSARGSLQIGTPTHASVVTSKTRVVKKTYREWTRFFPMSKSISVMLRIAADHGDEGEAEQAQHQENLPRRQPEFRLTVRVHSKAIEDDVNNNTHETHAPNRHVIAPISDHDRQRTDLERDDQSLIQTIGPASHEAKGISDEVTSEADETSGDWILDDHLSHAIVDECYDAGVYEEREEQTSWTCIVQAIGDADEEAGADGSARRDSVEVISLEGYALTNGYQLNLTVV